VVEQVTELCGCGCPLDPHVMVVLAEHEDARQGGLMFCPACGCVKTWSVQGWPRPVMPPPEDVAWYRTQVAASR
jgi:hypothetical protein